MSDSTINKPQEARNESQQTVAEWLSVVPIQAWALVLILGLMASGSLPVYVGTAIIVAGYLVLRSIEQKQIVLEAKARAKAWVNVIGPVVIGSVHPGETANDVSERAAYFREQLRLSGNPYAEKIPIIEMPYMPLLVEHGQLSAAWSIYQKSLGEQQHQANLSWYERGCPSELKALFANAVLPMPKQDQ